MAYEDTNCPCGGRKERETMLCQCCMEWLADHPSMKTFQDKEANWDARRHAAIVLITRARRRKHQQPGKLTPA